MMRLRYDNFSLNIYVCACARVCKKKGLNPAARLIKVIYCGDYSSMEWNLSVDRNPYRAPSYFLMSLVMQLFFIDICIDYMFYQIDQFD